MYKGKRINYFYYESISLYEHMKFLGLFLVVTVPLLLLSLFVGEIGLIIVFICINGFIIWTLWERDKIENSFPSFVLYEQGIEVCLHSYKQEDEYRWYSWQDLTNVELVGPFVKRSAKKLRTDLDYRPGFELFFSDGFKVLVYQRINQYCDFYEELFDRHVNGVKSESAYSGHPL